MVTHVELETQLEGSGALFLAPRNLFDAAIVGIEQLDNGQRVVAYDSEQVVKALMDQDGWDEDSAREWYRYNIAGSFGGPGTPVFIEPCEDD